MSTTSNNITEMFYIFLHNNEVPPIDLQLVELSYNFVVV